ncbi:peptidase S8, subtilisin-related protein [Purpureocillium lilacinum]|uniref:Peptidase S8, subtilisin-related protein n=1 Tax=Purpureocillium lilacinum TaxID=33203 RepID=A0A179GNV2_PURLI|nr:peptidase S8, subtilisin-related protein [Purpureocillium lilacinum]
MQVLALFFVFSAQAASAVAGRNTLAPLLKSGGQTVPGSYIVKLKDGALTTQTDVQLSSFTERADHVYTHAFHGFATKLDDESLVALRRRSDVEYIEHDGIASVNGYIEQPNAPWGLVRISHRQRVGTSYVYDDSAGLGTCAYIIDTGVDVTHPEFGNRAQVLKSFVNDTTDGNGHGTHLAGIIGSKTYGVAKKTRIYGVKVLDNSGSGTYSNIIAGMDFVAKDWKTRNCPKGAMANLSLGGSFSAAVNNAAASLVKAGVFTSVAAGGDNSDASRNSPASEPTVCTVGGTTRSDTRLSSSNYGPIVDIFAPGEAITSTWTNGGTNTISGTSTSAAYITGLGCYLAGFEGNPGAEPLCKRIQELATKDVIQNIPKVSPDQDFAGV